METIFRTRHTDKGDFIIPSHIENCGCIKSNPYSVINSISVPL